MKKNYTNLKRLSFLIVTIGFLSFVPYFIGPGLTTPVPVGAFLNGNFPDVSAANEPYVPAFTNLTFNSPLTFTPVPNSNKLVVGQRNGEIYWFDNNTNVAGKNLLVDLSNEVGVVWDGGFLGLAIHPEFGQPNKNYFYLYYTTKDGQGRDYPNGFISGFGCGKEDNWGGFLVLKRIEVNPNTFSYVANSDTVMMKMRMFSSTHRGGGIAFGKDGFLYIPTGDQSDYSKPQNYTTNLDGGVLRIDIDQDATKSHAPIRKMPSGGRFSDEISGVGYYIPNDNPFLNPGGGHFEEYYTVGHRNPHRMTMDRLTGNFYIGEIGESTHEEINVVQKGKNYGWPIYEGNQYRGTGCTDMLNGMSHENPLVAFPRGEANAIIGGYVYRGAAMPNYYGKYICADYGTGEEIWAVDTATGQYELITQFSPTNIISFGEDNNGELYLLSQGNNVGLYKLVQNGALESNIPTLLSETGTFDDLNTLEPSNGVIPYDLVEPFWSDGAEKQRWMVVPNNGTHNTAAEQITFSENGDWDFPVGAVLIKHFELPIDESNPNITKRLETRFSVKASNGSFYYLVYKWNDAGTDAVLLESGLEEDIAVVKEDGSTVTQKWTYPSTQDCISCHNPATGGTLGPKTRYLNTNYTYAETGNNANQLVTLSYLGILDENIDDATTLQYQTAKAKNDATASLDERARSYLDLNCAYCHRPGGTGDRAQFDLRLFNSLQQTGLLTAGTNTPIGVDGEKILVPGDASKSILYHRTNSSDASVMMPPIAKSVIDEEGVALLQEWINHLDPDLEVPELTEATYNLINVGSGLQMDVFDSGVNNYDDIIQWNATDGENQQFILEEVGNTYSFRIAHSNKFLDVEAQGQTAGTNLIQYDGNGSTAQLFDIAYAGNDEWTIKSVANNLFVGVEANSNTEGASIKTYPNDGSNYFKWKLVDVNNQPVIGMTLNTDAKALEIGEIFALTPQLQPTNATNKEVTWSSSDAAIATVNSTGVVTAITVGEATITATTVEGEFTANAVISVSDYDGCIATGTILMERYDGIEGIALTDLYNSTNYPNNPSSTQELSSFSIPVDAADYYGVRVSGYLCAPETGTYYLWVAGDDYSELSISTDKEEANKNTIAYHNGWTYAEEWNKYNTQKSVAISLERGQTYYIEALMKENGGGDNLAVGWRKPSDGDGVAPIEVIPGAVLSSALPSTEVDVTGVSVSPTSLQLLEGMSESLVATITPENATNKSVTWVSADVAIATVDANGQVLAIAEGVVQITATTVDGGFIASTEITVEKEVVISCSDGIKNGLETGIDCGGTDCEPCNTSCDVLMSYSINGIWEAAESSHTINVQEGDQIWMSTYPAADFTVTGSNGQVSGDATNGYYLLSITKEEEGAYNFVTANGCTQTLNIVVEESNTTCSSFMSFSVNGVWDSAIQDYQINVQSGDEIWLSMYPAADFTVVGPNGAPAGNAISGYYIIPITKSEEGTYTFETPSGCVQTLRIAVEETGSVCNMIPDYSVNGNWYSGNSEVSVNVGDEVWMSMYPSTVEYTVTDPIGNPVVGDYQFGFYLGTMTVDKAGTYVFNTTDGCQKTLTFTVQPQSLTASFNFNQIQEQDDIMLNPNPTDGYFEVYIGNLMQVAIHLSMYDASGKMVLQENISATHNTFYQVNATDLPLGVYRVMLETANGDWYSKSLIVR